MVWKRTLKKKILTGKSKMHVIKTKKDKEQEKRTKKIIMIIIILLMIGLVLLAALGNLDAIRTLWKTP